LKWGTGGINIDACRVETDEIITNHSRSSESAISKGKYGDSKSQETHQTKGQQQERFPANIILDEEAGKMLDEQSGVSSSKKGKERFSTNTEMFGGGHTGDWNEYSDKGGASRFFYCAKASKSERNYGCDDLDENTTRKNNHPTVKPLKLMEYLVKLVSREGSTILDPFVGSGTTAIACQKLGRNCIGIEKEEEYIKICEARLKPYLEQTMLFNEKGFS